MATCGYILYIHCYYFWCQYHTVSFDGIDSCENMVYLIVCSCTCACKFITSAKQVMFSLVLVKMFVSRISNKLNKIQLNVMGHTMGL